MTEKQRSAACRICEALGLSSDRVARIVIDIKADEIPRAYIEKHLEDAALDIVANVIESGDLDIEVVQCAGLKVDATAGLVVAHGK